MATWVIWIIVALAIIILELVVPGMSLICLSIGAFAAAVVAFLKFGFVYQLIAFSFFSLLSFFLIRPLFRSVFFGHTENTNVHALIGSKGKIIRAIPENGEVGWVKVSSEEWPAVSEDGKAMAEGKNILVTKVQGNTLTVKGI